MRNVPQIGIYSFNYEWMPTVSYFKSIGGENWESIVPKSGKNAVKNLLNDHKFKINKVDYMCVNYTFTQFKQKFLKNMGQKWVRFNLVFHPYLMDNLKLGAYEEKKWVMASIYTDDIFYWGLKRSKYNGISINAEDIFAESNWIEVHIHRADENDPKIMAVSPNNAGVLMDMTCPMITFYTIIIDQIAERKEANILVTHHTIIDDISAINYPLTQVLDIYNL